MRHLVRLAFHAHIAENFFDSLADGCGVFPSCSAQHEFQVVLHTSVHQQLEILEYDSDLAPEKRNVLVPYPVQFVAADFSAPFQERIFCYDCPDYGCFSGSDFSDDIHEITLIYIHVKSVYYRRFSIHYFRVSK